MKKSLFIIFSVLLIDQSIKIWIKTHMYLGQAHKVSGEWFYLHFVENPGMAFGWEIGEGAWGKVALSLFRLAAVAGIGYYLFTLFKKKVRPLLIVCVALIFAGALGNILDSVFYGKIFETSDPWDQNVATMFPKEGGYAGFLHGQVVDMFYFPVVSGTIPESFPFWKGEEFVFFRPVFNIADASISVGVFLLILFQRRLFGKQTKRLSARKIQTTNIFFGFVMFLISVFLLLTYFSLFSSVHPLPSSKIGIVLGLSVALGWGMFDMLRRWPMFDPDEEEVVPVAAIDPTTEKTTSENPAPEEVINAISTLSLKGEPKSKINDFNTTRFQTIFKLIVLVFLGVLLIYVGGWNLICGNNKLLNFAGLVDRLNGVGGDFYLGKYGLFIRINNGYYGFLQSARYFDSPIISWFLLTTGLACFYYSIVEIKWKNIFMR